jgi:hypothetical protein
MNKLKSLLNEIGLYDIKPEPLEETPFGVYSTGGTKVETAEHMAFLKSLDEAENKRLEAIEAKTSQMIAQTGIVFSLLSLFVPLLIDKISEINVAIKVALLIFLLLSFFLYMVSIWNALKNYDVKQFKYSSPSPKNVIDFQSKGVIAFQTEVVKDLLYALPRNVYLNNIKATNLLHSFMAFKIANLFAGCLVAIFCLSLLFFSTSTPFIKIEGQVKIEQMDSLRTDLKRFTNRPDSLPVKEPDRKFIVPFGEDSTSKK